MNKIMIFMIALVLAGIPLVAQTAPLNITHKANKSLHKVAWVNPLPPLPTPAPKPKPAPVKADTINPVTWLQGLAVSDLTNALALAQNDIVTKPCWTFLLGIVQGTIPSLIQTTPGIATGIQVAFNDEAMLASYFNPGGLFDQFGVACAPMINKINVQVVAGGTSIAAGIAGGPAGSAGVLAGLQAILSGVIALPKL
jgi:hypothetical protein